MNLYSVNGTIVLSISIKTVEKSEIEALKKIINMISSFNIKYDKNINLITDNNCVHNTTVNDIDIEWESVDLIDENFLSLHKKNPLKECL